VAARCAEYSEDRCFDTLLPPAQRALWKSVIEADVRRQGSGGHSRAGQRRPHSAAYASMSRAGRPKAKSALDTLIRNPEDLAQPKPGGGRRKGVPAAGAAGAAPTPPVVRSAATAKAARARKGAPPAPPPSSKVMGVRA
jgi:hypothetical protein